MTLTRDERGRLPAYAWPGGYQLVYFTADGGCLCPPCANGGNGSEATEDAGAEDGWRLVGQDVLYEGVEHCEHCGCRIVGSHEDE